MEAKAFESAASEQIAACVQSAVLQRSAACVPSALSEPSAAVFFVRYRLLPSVSPPVKLFGSVYFLRLLYRSLNTNIAPPRLIISPLLSLRLPETTVRALSFVSASELIFSTNHALPNL